MKAQEIVAGLDKNPDLAKHSDIRELRRERGIIEVQAFIGQALEQWSANKTFPRPPSRLTRLTASIRPRATDLLVILRAFDALHDNRTQEALDAFTQLLNERMTTNAIVRARLHGLRSLVRHHLGRGGRKDWQIAVDVLRGADAALPPELKTVEMQWAELNDDAFIT